MTNTKVKTENLNERPVSLTLAANCFGTLGDGKSPKLRMLFFFFFL